MNTGERLAVPDSVSLFERIRRTTAAGAEYWSSRDFAQILGYSDYRNFEQAMKRAKTACSNSGQRVDDHFGETTKMIVQKMKRSESKRSNSPETWNAREEGRTPRTPQRKRNVKCAGFTWLARDY